MKQNAECLILSDVQRPPPLARAKCFTAILHAPLTTHSSMPWDPAGSTFQRDPECHHYWSRGDYCNTRKKLPHCTFTPLIQYSEEGSFLNTEHTVFFPCSTPPPWISHLTQSKPQVLNLTYKALPGLSHDLSALPSAVAPSPRRHPPPPPHYTLGLLLRGPSHWQSPLPGTLIPQVLTPASLSHWSLQT